MSTATETVTLTNDTGTSSGLKNGNCASKQISSSSIEETEFMTTTKTTTTTNASSINSSNGHAVTANGTASTPPPIDTSTSEQLKILGHLKNIEIINEQRRAFLNKTVSETSNEQQQQKGSEFATSQSVTKAETTSTKTTTTNGEVEHKEHSAQCTFISEESDEQAARSSERTEHVLRAKVTIVPTASATKPTTPTLRSPMTPPPKPPMLSRTRSVGVGDNRASLNSLNSAYITPPAAVTPTTPIVTTTITTTTLAEPIQIQTIQLPVEQQSVEPAMAQSEKTLEIAEVESAIAAVKLRHPPSTQEAAENCTTNCNAEKPITAKHYEHLIEELKCPGCAYPMKAPILLCQTGHSVCEQCTRILMMCPLCKEPFTKIRSHTVEALCSKAHFRCINGPGGCTVRLQKDLLAWHEKQCIYKPMKCFMGRVWGDCQWDGREIQWKDHLETEHADRVFKSDTTDLIWNMGVKQKPLTGYYVFEAFDEMFNFYAIYDKERILYTMTCTSSVKEKKHHFAYEVTMIHPCNEALAITQKFPVHSEYDSDILMDGTCVSITLSDLAKFIDEDKLLHYRVRILEVNSPRKSKAYLTLPNSSIPKDFQNTQIAGVNLKSVPSDIIVTRREDMPLSAAETSPAPSTNGMEPVSTSEDEIEKIRRQYNRKIREDGDSDSDPEFEAFIAKRWGTPQLHFNRKYLKNISSDSSSNGDHHRNDATNGKAYQDDRISIASTNVSYKKRVSNTLRKSFRSIKSEFNGMRPFGKKSPEKILTE